MKTFKGVPASSGYAIGPVYVYTKTNLDSYILRSRPENSDREREDIRKAMRQSSENLIGLIKFMEDQDRSEEAEIFEIQREFLEDPSFGEEILALVDTGNYRAAWAIKEVSDKLVNEFAEIEDEYFRNRMSDIKDLANRLLRSVLNLPEQTLGNLEQPSVILSDDLTPTDTVQLSVENTLALCTRFGSTTSHSAILARSMGLPAIVGLGHCRIRSGNNAIVDAVKGLFIAKPNRGTISTYRKRESEYMIENQALLKTANEPARSRDGKIIKVVANIGSADDARRALSFGVDGVGLFRSEFLFLERADLPDEEKQYTIYREIFSLFGKLPIVFRCLDAGGDKQLPGINMPHEQNPFLGQRAIRLSLANRSSLLFPQLRAVLRAGKDKDLRIMFPMVALPAEFRLLKELTTEVINELSKEGTPHNSQPQLGIMIEIPSAAICAELFAEDVDFFSIGTNDLTQYTLAADRTNEKVSELANCYDPSIIRLMASVVDVAHKKGKWVGICGEMASYPEALPLLLALGLDELSMSPPSIPRIKQSIRMLNIGELQSLRDSILSAESPTQLQEIGITELKRVTAASA